MKYLIPALVLLSIFVFQHCKSTQYTPEDYPARQIVFGSGGGFAGTYNHFYLFENGQLFKNSSTNPNFVKVKTIKKKQVSQLFDNYDNLHFENIKINDPGNMSFYVEFKTKDKSHKMLWGGNNKTIDPNVKTVYDILMKYSRVEE